MKYSVLFTLPQLRVVVEQDTDAAVEDKAYSMVSEKTFAELCSKDRVKAVVTRDGVFTEETETAETTEAADA